jgi:hypothetical protein
VKTPEGGQTRRLERVTQGVRQTPECGRGLSQVVLQEVGFGESRPDGEIVFRRQGAATLELGQNLCGFRTTSAQKRGGCASQGRLNRCRAHVGSIRGIQRGVRRVFT